MGQNPVPLVNIKIGGTWVFNGTIGFDPWPTGGVVAKPGVLCPLFFFWGGKTGRGDAGDGGDGGDGGERGLVGALLSWCFRLPTEVA